MESSSDVPWPTGLGYVRSRMNYFLSLQEDEQYRSIMIHFLAVYIFFRYDLQYGRVLTTMAFILEYLKSRSIILNIAAFLCLIILVIGWFFIAKIIRYIDNRLPSSIRPYVLLSVLLYAVLVTGYYMCVVFIILLGGFLAIVFMCGYLIYILAIQADQNHIVLSGNTNFSMTIE